MPEPRRPFSPLRLLRQAGTVLLVVVLGLAGGTAFRLTRAPLALPAFVTAEVERRAEAGLGGADLSIGQVALLWDLEAGLLRLGAAGLSLARDGEVLVALPAARVTLDGASLLRGRLRPRDLDLEGLTLNAARDADGRFSLRLGAGGGGLPRDPAAALAMLDGVLAAPAVAELDAVRVGGITLRLRDAVTGLAQDVTDGVLRLRRDGEGVSLTLDTRLPVGPGRAADLSLTVERGAGAEARASVEGLPLGWLADTLPGVPALGLASGVLSLEAGGRLESDGTLGPLAGRAELRDARLTDRPEMALDRAVLGLGWVPGSDRIELTEIDAGSDEVALSGSGQILLEEGVTGPIQMQLRFTEAELDPEGLFERRVRFEQGLVEARLTQAPLAIDIGQALLTGPSGTARASGRVTFEPEGLRGTLRLGVPEMDVGDLVSLWPPEVAPGARRWFTTNMLAGLARNATALVRLEPGAAPDIRASLSYEAASLRFMRYMPPLEGARGAGVFDGRRVVLRVDEAAVPAIGPGEARTVETALLRIADSVFVIPDATARPLRGELTLRAGGGIGDVLTLLNNRPLRLLDRTKRDRRLASGTAEATVEVQLPLRPGNAPADIDWTVDATLRNVASSRLVPGRTLRGEALRFAATPEAVEISGTLSFEGIPFQGGWRQALQPRGTDPILPDAPPPPPRPLPSPGRVEGVARVGPADLERLGLALSSFSLSGRTAARVEVSLPQGGRPSLSVRSDLAGLAVGLPAISWSKPASRAVSFSVDALLGGVPEVRRIALDAPGLAAEGRVALREGGGLDRATFTSVDTGWFRGPVTFVGRGRGVPARIQIRGGRADLRRALLSRGSGGGGGEGSPVDVALDRLTVTEGIALTGLRATLGGGAGEFSGAVNGGTPVSGRLVPDRGGTAVQIVSGDAGGLLRSAGLFRDVRGGRMQLTLRPTGQQGVYAGALRAEALRVRNAPALASLLQALSVVGILEQLDGQGLAFQSVESDFVLRPGDILVRRASAVGPSMSITADGAYDLGAKRMDLQGVISPIYLVNGLFGTLFSREDEGLFGFTYRLRGPVSNPQVGVNPLSILTPGRFREIFRRAPPGG